MSTKVIIWDFDGTLALHEGLWSGTVMFALDELCSGHKISIDQIKPLLLRGFPWHEPEKSHPELSAPDAWWRYMTAHCSTIFQCLGFDLATAWELSSRTHEIYIDESRYVVYPDTIEVLSMLKQSGWKNVILSNHVPELPDIVDKLGFSNVIDECFSSALIGYEKPHIMAFKYVLSKLRYPEICVMVGDNPTADVKGALAAGIPAILLHADTSEKTINRCKNIGEVPDMLAKLFSGNRGNY